jgi:hypothetical protein
MPDKSQSLSTEQHKFIACGVPLEDGAASRISLYCNTYVVHVLYAFPQTACAAVSCQELFMPKHTLLSEPDHVDEPQQVQDYWGLVSRVAATQHPVIVRRGGADVAAVIPVEYLELLREFLAQQEAEQRAAQVDWAHMAQVSPPPSQWFEGDEPKPF